MRLMIDLCRPVNLAENGVPPQTLLKMGGWSDIETVQNFYLKNSDANKKKAVEGLERLMGSRDEAQTGTII